MKILLKLAVICSLFYVTALAQFNDTGWEVVYQENFDTDFVGVDGQTFGTDNWLIFQLIDGGAITVANGYAQLNAPDFWNAALIRSTNSLPAEYKIRTKIGYINYDLTNYEQADYDNPNFDTHSGHYENGMYFLTVTDDTCSGGQCAENWWHYHRKMVIDVDNHINWSDSQVTNHPVYMAYMAPETNSGGNLLRTWTGSLWDESAWNWNAAYTYEYNTWYYAELEKRNNYIILRLYDESQNIIEETTPVTLDKVFAMDDTDEYLYLGEPHTDDYEGNVRIDEITLLELASTSINIISDFESGNIANIQEIGTDSISFEIRLDDAHGDTYGWYYFAITDKMGETVTLFLTNPDGWQDANDCPRYSNDNQTWYEMPDASDQGDTIVMRHTMGADTVWFAQSIPYTITNFDQFVESISASILQLDTIGYSVHNRPITLLTISDTTWSDEFKKTVWITSRQHPMESQATYVLQGLLEEVTDGSDFASHWGEDIILKVVPIVNVDGVVEGYSRHNVNGYNLNRDWQTILSNEQPEVNATHTAIDNYLDSGKSIDLFLDLHSAPNYYDYGYRMSLTHVDSVFYENQSAFLTLMEAYDSWQNKDRWGYMGAAGYSGGVSAWVLNDMYGLDGLVPENSWTRRNDYSCVEANSLVEQGGNWAQAVYDYLFPIQAQNFLEESLDSIIIGDSFHIALQDYLQCGTDSLLINIYTADNLDSEKVYVHNQLSGCNFKTEIAFKSDNESPTKNDGILSMPSSNEFVLEYTDPGTPSRKYHKLLKGIDSSMVVSVDDDNTNEIPSQFILSQNHPNPFNPQTLISFKIPATSEVNLTIYNIVGQEIMSLVNDRLAAGDYTVSWNGKNKYGNKVSSGVYLYRMQAGEQTSTKKMLLLK